MLVSLPKRIFLYSQSVDMRKGFDGLSGIVSQQMGANSAIGRCVRVCGSPQRPFKVTGMGAIRLCVVLQTLRGRDVSSTGWQATNSSLVFGRTVSFIGRARRRGEATAKTLKTLGLSVWIFSAPTYVCPYGLRSPTS